MPTWRTILVAIPNVLSATRVGLAAGFLWVESAWQVPMIILAALTDVADGALGRLLNAASDVGRLLDPVADKLFVLAVVGRLFNDGMLSATECVLVGFRDLAVAAGVAATLALGRSEMVRHMRPTWLGKAATAAQFAFLATVLAAPSGRPWTYVFVVSLSILAAGQYSWQFLTQFAREKNHVSRS